MFRIQNNIENVNKGGFKCIWKQANVGVNSVECRIKCRCKTPVSQKASVSQSINQLVKV